MKLTLTDAKLLKDAIAVISELVTEAQFTMTQDAMELVALDPATVAMVEFKLLASAFEVYKVEQEETISINLMNFKQVLRRAGGSDSITLETTDNKLKVIISGRSTRTFHLPLIDFEDARRQVPKVNYTATVTLNSEQFTGAIEDADIVAESVAFLADDDTFSVAAEGDLSKVIVEMKQDPDTKIVVADSVEGPDGKEAPIERPVRARYSIEYLKKMALGAKLADKVMIQFRTDHPLKIDYRTLNKVQLVFILAPRVEND